MRCAHRVRKRCLLSARAARATVRSSRLQIHRLRRRPLPAPAPPSFAAHRSPTSAFSWRAPQVLGAVVVPALDLHSSRLSRDWHRPRAPTQSHSATTSTPVSSATPRLPRRQGRRRAAAEPAASRLMSFATGITHRQAGRRLGHPLAKGCWRPLVVVQPSWRRAPWSAAREARRPASRICSTDEPQCPRPKLRRRPCTEVLR
mgnify:CR=1 FL=1